VTNNAQRPPVPNARGISVVVPAYRSPGTLARLCTELHQHVAPLVDEMEVILVDDGSGDETWDSITALAQEHDWVRGMSLLRNYGQHNALLAGLRDARFPVVLTIDDDLQNPPDQVPRLWAALADDVDLVYGTPSRPAHGTSRHLASTLTKRFMSAALGPEVHPQSSAFRIFRRELIDAGDGVSDPFLSIDVLLSWATTRVRVVEVDFAERTTGRSAYGFGKLVRHAVNMITGYSTRPLRWVSLMGLACATFGFALLAYVITRWLLGGADVAGFTFLAAAITLFSGVQLLSLGVLGEYLGRMHFRSMGRPPYIVRRRTETSDGTGMSGADPV
jgi:undecaprenyl-phosphate 4-deoxy-4-formamido-L-arabinose transferase